MMLTPVLPCVPTTRSELVATIKTTNRCCRNETVVEGLLLRGGGALFGNVLLLFVSRAGETAAGPLTLQGCFHVDTKTPLLKKVCSWCHNTIFNGD